MFLPLAKLTNAKFVELGSRSIGFLLRTRCLVLKEHPPRWSADPAWPTPTRPCPGPKKPPALSQRPERSCGSRRKVLVFGSPSVQFSEVFTHVGMRPWASLSYIRLGALSTRRTE